MAEIPALQAGRAFAVQNDARIQRELQEENRARVELQRQQQLDAQARIAAEQRAADLRRLQQLREDIRLRQENTAFLEAREDLRLFDDLDQEFFLLQTQIEEETLDARALRADASAPEVSPLAPFELPALGPAAPLEAPDENRDLTFQSLEEARDARLAERRTAAQDAAVQLRIDLQVANDRIAETLFNPDLPRGSVVDLTA